MRWVLTEDLNVKKIWSSGFHCLYLVCNFGLWGLAMSCVESLPKFHNCITVSILKMSELEDAVCYSIGLAVEVRVRMWNLVLCKAVFLVLSGAANHL